MTLDLDEKEEEIGQEIRKISLKSLKRWNAYPNQTVFQ
jgi:hypothetical protein